MVDGAIILVTGGVIAAEIAKTGTLTLTVGGEALTASGMVGYGYEFGKFGKYIPHVEKKIFGR